MTQSVPMPFVTLITLGVTDMTRARNFYETLGWHASSASQGNIVFFHSNATALSLYPHELLAEDAMQTAGPCVFSGITLAANQRSEADVDIFLDMASKAGGTIVKPAQKVFWGGYSGYFSDPDGHIWEVAYNPFVEFDANGRMRLPA